mgnify:CR=1 FL=1
MTVSFSFKNGIAELLVDATSLRACLWEIIIASAVLEIVARKNIAQSGARINPSITDVKTGR